MAKTKCVGYLRVSGKDQIVGDGFPRQRKAITAYAASHDLHVECWYEEKGISGKTGWENRPAWIAMMNSLDGVKVIVIERLDRLARDLFIQEYILRDLAKRGVKLLTAADEDTGDADPTRVLFRQILGAVAAYDRAMVVTKLKGARERMKEKTGRCEGRKPYGHYPGEKEVLSLMVQANLRGSNHAQIVRYLSDLGYKNRSGKSWHPHSIKRILESH